MEQWRPIPPVDSEVGRERGADKRYDDQGSRVPAARVLSQNISHLRGTLRWLGWGRIATGIISVPLVGWGAFFLLRSPAPPVDATLAYATTVPAALSSQLQSTFNPADGPEVGPVLVTIHVAGQVISPGVYQFSPGVRVVDAVRAAGGATQDADLNAVNLAGTLDDGQQIYIPALGERSPGSAASSTASAESGPSLPIHLNQATAEELDILPGIGPSTALAIVAYRERNGPFLSIEGLLDVPGIGPAKLAALAGLITV